MVVESINAARLQELILGGEVDVIDVRDPHEWANGHMEAARHVPLSRLRTGAKAFLPRDHVAFVCAAGVRSNMAAQLAVAAGLTKVYNLAGGTKAWTTAGYALVRPSRQAVG
ncbi:MAG: rhodanese-like protein [Myxococcaceae bacterium]|nr:rhodanese-like protein [Myxococcaceae bacterium]